MQTVRISIVDYTNTLPFRWALKHSDVLGNMQLTEDHPGECARKLENGEADIALVPVAIIPGLKNPRIVSDYCIGANGVVDSVKLYSEVPVNDISDVLLDYQSRTSVTLARILFREHWKRNPRFTPAGKGFESKTQNTVATVVIGDRTFALNGKHRYEFDLAEEWKKLTGLPFVFAAWVATSEIDPRFLTTFNKTLASGVMNVDRAIAEEPLPASISQETAKEYLQHRIDYLLDDMKREAMQLFFSLMKAV